MSINKDQVQVRIAAAKGKAQKTGVAMPRPEKLTPGSRALSSAPTSDRQSQKLHLPRRVMAAGQRPSLQMRPLVLLHPHAHFTADDDVIIRDIHWRRK